MRKLLKFLLERPILWIAQRYASAPVRDDVSSSLTELLKKITTTAGKKGFVIPFDLASGKFIIFSDQHKGKKDGADDFARAEPNYLAALNYYHENDFHLVALGDCEELWENTWLQVRRHNKASFQAERKFVNMNRFTKIFGNHDLDWDIDPLAPTYLKEIFGREIIALEGVLLSTQVEGRDFNILCTHGHQGDKRSDGNWFSKFFISKIWAPLQAYIQINPNTPAHDAGLKTLHDRYMYEWSAQQSNLLLITGHTHQPVFESLTHLERLQLNREVALYQHNQQWAEAIENEMLWRGKEEIIRADFRQLKPTYFNSGCCCFADGDITGIEIADGFLRLIKWKRKDGTSQRVVLEEKKLEKIFKQLLN